MSLQATTSQTVGPFFKIGLDWLNCANLAGPRVAGEWVTVEGRVLTRWCRSARRDYRAVAGEFARQICASGRYAGQAYGG